MVGKTISGPRPFSCFRSHLSLHKKKHSHVLCRCNQCGRFLQSEENLERHMKTHHSTPFKCEECGKIFKTKDTLKKHRMEHGELNFKCEVSVFITSGSDIMPCIKIYNQLVYKPLVCHILKYINHYSCIDIYSYSCLNPLSNEGNSITLVNVNAPVVATTSWWLHFSAPVVA